MLTSILAAVSLATLAAAHPASSIGVATVQAEFQGALLTRDVPELAQFDPKGIITVNYTTTARVIANGQVLPRDQVLEAPTFKIKGTAESETQPGLFNNATDNATKFAVMLVDFAAPGNDSTSVRHYAVFGLTRGENDDHSITPVPSPDAADNPVAVQGGAAYIPPTPPAGSGPHRYTWLVPDNFTAPTFDLSTPVFNFTDFYRSSNLGPVVAGLYFIVENTTATTTTASIAATTPVNPSTLAQFTPSSSMSHGGDHAAPSGRNGAGGLSASIGLAVLAAGAAVLAI